MEIYFSDAFDVKPSVLARYGAFDISLINDLPLFIDPFLLFNSRKRIYRQLHANIIRYVRFLKDKASDSHLSRHLIAAWYYFPEVKQSWLGFSVSGNKGQGLREDFAVALHKNLHAIFHNFGKEPITKGSHLEKLCLIKDGVGRDKISDFTTNLIKDYLLEYTQTFAMKHLTRRQIRRVVIPKVVFNYRTETWQAKRYTLPFYNGDYVILTPKDLLTRDDIWINKEDLYNSYHTLPAAISDGQLRVQVDNYLKAVLPKKPKPNDYRMAIASVISKFPAVLDYYIRSKEERGNEATDISNEKVSDAEQQYIEQIKALSRILEQTTAFYQVKGSTYDEAMQRVRFLKDVIENKDGYRMFYAKGKPIERESDLQIAYRLTWFASSADVNREVNNGRGPADFKVSRGKHDATLVEFKLASNTQLRRNLEKQVEIYQKASDTKSAIKAILYFDQAQLAKVRAILKELKLEGNKDVVLIDCRKDNKPSASKA